MKVVYLLCFQFQKLYSTTHLSTVEQLSGAQTVGERFKNQVLLKEKLYKEL